MLLPTEPIESTWMDWWELDEAPFVEAAVPDRAGLRALLEGSARPVLLRVLEGEHHPDLVSCCMRALAGIGDPGGAHGVAARIQARLAGADDEVSGDAVLALGILGDPTSIPLLLAFAHDGVEGRELVAREEVPERMRAFALYALAVIGERASAEVRDTVERALRAVLANGASLELEVAAAVGLRIVSIPHRSDERLGLLLRVHADAERDVRLRGHCLTTIAVLIGRSPTAVLQSWHERLVESCIAELAERGSPVELRRSAAIALGVVGTTGPDQRRLREALVGALADGDLNTRYHALIALGRVGGAGATPGDGAVVADIAALLRAHLEARTARDRAWAALTIGVLQEGRGEDPAGLQAAVRQRLAREEESGVLGALCAASGLARDLESVDALRTQLSAGRREVQSEYAALGLALIGDRRAIPELRIAQRDARYAPGRLRRATIGLGLLGDEQSVPALLAMLEEARSLAPRATLCDALGAAADPRAVGPLLRALQDPEWSPRGRAFAAFALAQLADAGEPRWNARLGLHLDPNAGTGTLLDRSTGMGVLDRH